MALVSLNGYSTLSNEKVLNWGVNENYFEEEEEGKVAFSMLRQTTLSSIERMLEDLGVVYRIESPTSDMPTQFILTVENDEINDLDQIKDALCANNILFLEDFNEAFDAKQTWLDQSMDYHISSAYMSLLNTASFDDTQSSFDRFYQNQNRSNETTSPYDYFSRKRKAFANPHYSYDFSTYVSEEEVKGFLEKPMSHSSEELIRSLLKKLSGMALEEFMESLKEHTNLKAEFQNLHPLRYLAFIFSDPECIQHSRSIMCDEKKAALLTIMVQVPLNKNRNHPAFNNYFRGLINYLNLNESTAAVYLKELNFKGFVRYLLRMYN